MRKLIGILAIFIVVALFAWNQNSKLIEPTETTTKVEESQAAAETPETTPAEEAQYVEHVCSEVCTPEKHILKHGEKGHVCDENCS